MSASNRFGNRTHARSSQLIRISRELSLRAANGISCNGKGIPARDFCDLEHASFLPFCLQSSNCDWMFLVKGNLWNRVSWLAWRSKETRCKLVGFSGFPTRISDAIVLTRVLVLVLGNHPSISSALGWHDCREESPIISADEKERARSEELIRLDKATVTYGLISFLHNFALAPFLRSIISRLSLRLDGTFYPGQAFALKLATSTVR